MATGLGEYVHISQFYETIMLIILLIPFFAYALVFRQGVWQYTSRRRIQENEDQTLDEQQQPNTEIQRQIDSIESSSRRETQQIKQEEPPFDSQPEQPKLEEEGVVVQPQQSGPGQSKRSVLAQMIVGLVNDENIELTRDQQKIIYFHEQIGEVYQKHLPVILVVVVMGIILQTNEVFSLAMFYCYVISNFMLDYVQMFHRLKREYQSNAVAPFVNLVSGGFLVAIFVNLLTRKEFALVTE